MVKEQLRAAECLNSVALSRTYKTGLSKYYSENMLNTKLSNTKINSNTFDTPCKFCLYYYFTTQ